MVELTAEQKKTVGKWAADGAGISDIQKRLVQEFQIHASFMDVRFLLIDLNVGVKDKPAKAVAPPTLGPAVPKAAASVAGAGPLGDELEDDAGVTASAVKVQVDDIARAGAIVNGTVTFSDGVTASWALDQSGRLAIGASKPGYKPNQEDLMDFQEELRRQLQRKGF